METVPKGTVTFLFTDIVGSTLLWTEHPEAMQEVQKRHDTLMRGVIDARHGYVFKTVGDQICAAFEDAADALTAAVDAQTALTAETWPAAIGQLKVRMGLHTGTVQLREGDYFGLTLSHIARLHSAAHGGQIVLSQSTAELVRANLPPGVSLLDLGVNRFKDIRSPERVFQVKTPGLPADFPPLKSLDTTPNNLPRQLSSFIGRETELKEMKHHLTRTRMLTLTGPGGTGKTRLCLKAAEELLGLFPEGVYFVPLAAVSDPAHVPGTVARELSVKENPGESLTAALCRYISEKKMLLVLDNFEQVVGAAPEVARLLEGTQNLEILVSSREPLRIRGEQEYPVAPLDLPAEKQAVTPEELLAFEAPALFVQHASCVNPHFTVTEMNGAAVAEICRRLEGLPLAIELAASWIRTLSPAQLLGRITDRFKILSSDKRDLPERQRTIRNTIDWSYNLLDGGERMLFARLGVFRGGFTLEAAEKVCGFDLPTDALAGLESLQNKSFLRRREEDSDVPRFDMLETIREYAEELLTASAENKTVRDRHGIFYAELTGLCREINENITTAGSVKVKNLLEADLELGNIRAALTWSISGGDAATGVRILTDLTFIGYYFFHNLHREAMEWALRLLSLEKEIKPEFQCRVYYIAGAMACLLYQLRESEEYLNKSIQLALETGDKDIEADSKQMLAMNIFFNKGLYSKAEVLFAEAQLLFRETKNKFGEIRTTINLGEMLRVQERFQEAQTAYESVILGSDAIEIYADSMISNNMGFIKKNLGLNDEAGTFFQKALDHQRDSPVGVNLFDVINGILGMASIEKGSEKAARLCGALLPILEIAGKPMDTADRCEYDKLKAGLIGRLGEDEFIKLEKEGRSMTMEEAIGYALRD